MFLLKKMFSGFNLFLLILIQSINADFPEIEDVLDIKIIHNDGEKTYNSFSVFEKKYKYLDQKWLYFKGLENNIATYEPNRFLQHKDLIRPLLNLRELDKKCCKLKNQYNKLLRKKRISILKTKRNELKEQMEKLKEEINKIETYIVTFKKPYFDGIEYEERRIYIGNAKKHVFLNEYHDFLKNLNQLKKEEEYKPFFNLYKYREQKQYLLQEMYRCIRSVEDFHPDAEYFEFLFDLEFTEVLFWNKNLYVYCRTQDNYDSLKNLKKTIESKYVKEMEKKVMDLPTITILLDLTIDLIIDDILENKELKRIPEKEIIKLEKMVLTKRINEKKVEEITKELNKLRIHDPEKKQNEGFSVTSYCVIQ